jgi:hypothetical protein
MRLLGTLSGDTTIAFGRLLTEAVSGGTKADSSVALVSISPSKFKIKTKNEKQKYMSNSIWYFQNPIFIASKNSLLIFELYSFITC